MFLKEAARYEALATVGALIRSLPCVVPNVQDQSGPLREPPVALRATVRLFARVYAPMNAEVLFAGEHLVAQLALDGLLVHVAPPVLHQSSLGRQHRAAQVAQMLHLVVQPVLLLQMPIQEQLLRETFQAHLARVLELHVPRLVRGQSARVLAFPVGGEVLLVRVGLVAVLAPIDMLPRVDVHVHQVLRPRDEAFLAFLAPERVVLGVPSAMDLEVRLLVGPIVAQVAGEFLQVRVNAFVAGYVHRASKGFARTRSQLNALSMSCRFFRCSTSFLV